MLAAVVAIVVIIVAIVVVELMPSSSPAVLLTLMPVWRSARLVSARTPPISTSTGASGGVPRSRVDAVRGQALVLRFVNKATY
jgi:hypothetical protein